MTKVILFSGNDAVSVNIDNNAITSENKNDLLDIDPDSSLFFEDHINCLCKKASPKFTSKNRSIYVPGIQKNIYESIFNIPIWILFFSLGVS